MPASNTPNRVSAEADSSAATVSDVGTGLGVGTAADWNERLDDPAACTIGAGMAVDRAMPGQSGATYQFYGTKITTQAQNVEQLTSDIKKHGDNRVMLLAGYSGQ